MARKWAHDWRGLALAALTAVALATVCAAPVDAQAAKKGKKAPEPQKAEEGAQSAAPEKKKKLTAAEAQQAVDAALKLLEAGKAEQAAQSLTSTLGAGRLPPAVMAKALLYRGIAYRQQKKPAQAIADLTSALWLKGGLAESERKDALSQRTSAYQEAGLTESGEPIAAPVVPQPPRAPTRTASVSPSSAPDAATAPPPGASLAPQAAPAAESQSSGVWNPFGNLFGGASTSSAPPQSSSPPPSADAILSTDTQPVPVRTPQPRAKSARAWSSNTEVRAGPAPAPAPAPTETAALPPKAEGKFRVQVGMVRTQDQARELAGKVKGQYAAAFGLREPQIDQAVVGNMGSFYRVRVGPFASPQEGQAACAKLKGSGLDCLVVTQ